MAITDIDALLSSAGAPSFFRKQSPIGATVTGTVLEVTGRQNTDFISGDPLTWDDGRPQMLIAITLQTALRDHAEDDGKRGLYIKTWGAQAAALKEAVKAAGGATAGAVLRPGATLTATFTGETPSKAGSPTKMYAYQIVPAALAAVDQVGGQPTAPATPPVSAPAPAPVSAPAPAAPVAPPAAAPAASAAPTPASTAKSLAALGMTAEQIAPQLGLDVNVVAMLIAAA